MSIADHFDHSPDTGFIRTYDSQTARRQFQVSVVLILVLATAAVGLGLLVRFDESSSATSASSFNLGNSHYASQLHGSHI